MTHHFEDSVVAGVLSHMNQDHGEDNILIARAFGAAPDISSATMTGFDGEGGDWLARSAEGDEIVIRVPWPGGPITERTHVRREIVALYDRSCDRLGITPRPHA